MKENRKITRYVKVNGPTATMLLRSVKTYSFLLLILLCHISQAQESKKITISNLDPRLDSNDEIVDAHDGRVIQFGDRFYWYGTSYGTTNGFTSANHYVCYSSTDMMHWKKERRLIPNQPEGVYYRPHVIYNKKSKKYVLWYNWYPKLWDGQFGVATSDQPEGPFEIQNDNLEMANSSYGLGDFGLFVDDDETAYISYNTIQGHQVSIEKLNEDYTASTMENGGFISKHMEAGSMFKRDGNYYLLTDYTCCFCNYGSGARVYISDQPLSGYRLTGNVNRYPGKFANHVIDGIKLGNAFEALKKKDGNYEAIELYLKEEVDVSKIQITLFTGNRPENCGNVDNPRVHPEFYPPNFEFFGWKNNSWIALETSAPNSSKQALVEQLQFNVSFDKLDRIKIVPANDYTFENIYVSEVEIFNSEQSVISSSDAVNAFITGSSIPQRPIIPAQQTYVMQLETVDGPQFIWMGDLWGSASDNVKGHDYQYWAPLEFKEDGTLKSMHWVEEWSVKIE